MFSIFSHKSVKQEFPYYFIYTKDNDKMTSGKIVNATNIISNNNDDKFLMEILDDNVFIKFQFYYTTNVFYHKQHSVEDLYINDCFTNYYFNKNDLRLKNKMISDTMKMYNTAKQKNSFKEFSSFVPDVFAINDVLFKADILFLNEKNINNKEVDYYLYSNDYSNHDDLYIFYTITKKDKDKVFFNNSCSFTEEGFNKAKNLLNLKNKELYLTNNFSKSLTKEYFVSYCENIYIRASDFNINIVKLKNIFELGIKHPELYDMLIGLKQQSLDHFKTYINQKTEEYINEFRKKSNMFSQLNMKMFV